MSLISLLLTWVILFLVQPNHLTQTDISALIWESTGLIFLYNWLPIALIMRATFFATGRLALTCGLVGLLFIIPAFANRFMIEMRHAALRPLDLLLWREFSGIAHSIRPAMYIGIALGLLGCILVLILATKLVKNIKPATPLRIGGSIACIGILALLLIFVYGDTRRYNSLPVSGNEFNFTHQYQSGGFVFSFLHNLHHSQVVRPYYFHLFESQIKLNETPEDLSQSLQPSQPTNDIHPHVVMILSEAFSDLGMSAAINFDGFPNPMYNFQAIKEESIHGHIVVPHIGGGTADTEFDILTGINIRRFWRGMTYGFTMVDRSFPGIVNTLNNVGYRSMAMHPGAGWFYNRENVYLYLGFEAFLCDSTFDILDQRGGYISERHTIDRILEEFRGHLDTQFDTPLFLKAITIQNHGPYYGKYGDIDINFNTDANLMPSEISALAQYFYGMMDVDKELRRLVEYFRAEDDPVILVYYGDHLPSFPLAIYEALIPLEADAVYGKDLIRYNRLPFFIWANDAARPWLESFSEEYFAQVSTISAHYLGGLLLEILGISDPFFDFVNSLRPEYPVVLERTFFPNAASGSFGDMVIFNHNVHQNLALYSSWAYFRLLGHIY
ncbi:MAG: LTA synthase family protein [Defluviitaleaceae bacterium]|nr:LTA synthase family protein [Defluviitaleaceae bacterium]